MRVDGVAFDAPAGLEDSSTYCYRSGGTHEELTVEFELPVGAATPADDVIAEIREGLEGYFDAECSIVAHGDQTFIGQPGKFLHYRLDGAEQVVSKIVVANAVRTDGSRGDWIKLVWSGEPSAAAAGVDAIVDPIAASFTPASQAPQPVLAGHVRQQAGDWVLDVPAHLVGPRTFIYEDTAAELRVELKVLLPGASEPDLDPDSDDGEMARSFAKRRVDLVGKQAGEHRWVVLSASGPSREAVRLSAIVGALLASVRAEEMI